MNQEKGFTLIELIIAVVIVGILARIAIPAYTSYVLKGNRRAAQAAMLDIAQREQQYLLATRSYAGTLAALNYTLATNVSQYYTVVPTVQAGPPPGFTITATAIGNQASDGGPLTLDNTGTKSPTNLW